MRSQKRRISVFQFWGNKFLNAAQFWSKNKKYLIVSYRYGDKLAYHSLTKWTKPKSQT